MLRYNVVWIEPTSESTTVCHIKSTACFYWDGNRAAGYQSRTLGIIYLGYIIHPCSNLHVLQAVYLYPRVLSICARKPIIFSFMLIFTTVLSKVLCFICVDSLNIILSDSESFFLKVWQSGSFKRWQTPAESLRLMCVLVGFFWTKEGRREWRAAKAEFNIEWIVWPC